MIIVIIKKITIRVFIDILEVVIGDTYMRYISRALNTGSTKEVPWVLELSPMLLSGSTKGENGNASNIPIMIVTVDRFAREIGFEGCYQLNLPQGATEVWTISKIL